jgi:tRNA-splicing ligase RtcB (3'-phosphate/5'-hydroxy nucleic acid ligase)
MIEIKGKETSAKIFTENVEETALNQIKELCDQSFLNESKIRIMPDVHAGKGCTIGTTITLKDKVTPNLVGVDIGCGVLTVQLNNKEIDFSKLDNVIREKVPHGRNVHEHAIEKEGLAHPTKFKAYEVLDEAKYYLSVGTLGGGNHFIEVSQDADGFLYLSIHTGSRYVGAKIAQYYQKKAISELKKIDLAPVIEQLKTEGRVNEIESTIKKLKSQQPAIKNELAYLQGESFDSYIHDMKLAQKYALENRKEIANIIVSNMGLSVKDQFDTIHNYIDTENMILRKGAVSAQKGEHLIIPINMRDGSIIAVGKGNEDWNCSAPHGAGRVLSRTKAHKQLDYNEFKDTMKDVWTTSVAKETLDEAPMAYKNMEDILKYIGDTVDIVKVIKPLYNFKGVE